MFVTICDAKGETEIVCLRIVYADMKKELRDLRNSLIVSVDQPGLEPEIGRASCRERV